MSKYLTIKEPSKGEYREKGSKFLTYAYPVNDEEQITGLLDQLWKEHPKARHVCYAYRLGKKGEKEKMNDDGEPANTAGAPIMNHLRGNELTFVLLAAVRYFGGTKLGKGGLINAYGTAAKDALEKAEIIEEVPTRAVKVRLPYSQVDPFMQLVKKHNIEIGKQEFDTICKFTVYFPEGETEEWIERLYKIEGVEIEI